MKEYDKIPAQAVVEVTTSWLRTCLLEIGRDLKKDGTPRKHPKKCSVEQRNLLRVNGEPVKNSGYGE